MIERFWMQRLDSFSDNRKSPIQNPKLVALFAIVLALAMCGARVEAQQPGKIFRIGFLDASTASGMGVIVDTFRQELNKLEWIEGKNITIELRFADQKRERLRDLASELVRLKVDVIVTSGSGPTRAAKEATVTVPIVMAQDPILLAMVSSPLFRDQEAISPDFRV